MASDPALIDFSSRSMITMRSFIPPRGKSDTRHRQTFPAPDKRKRRFQPLVVTLRKGIPALIANRVVDMTAFLTITIRLNSPTLSTLFSTFIAAV
jgi:hypothetical protein